MIRRRLNLLAGAGAVCNLAIMGRSQTLFTLSSPEETCWLAAQIGAHLRAGDVVLLEGEIGAGKTHFARCLIRARTTPEEEVPSPTFTLVQTYETDEAEIWHADLYRLTNADDALELGLEEAFDTAICLVEWPDRLDGAVPDTGLTLTFRADDTPQSRTIMAQWSAPRWEFLTELAANG